ncbi:MAG TPA: isocitrate lyase/phosphoenolpyruvate mutase family protein [Jatrophihabitans sp.]|nr:isocitrate lyase/phosphoenolpyruvate mutase family protein [Jatrophihabitans sp.]
MSPTPSDRKPSDRKPAGSQPAGRAKAETFRRLHQPGTPLLMPNPWDAGSAWLLTGLGFAALGTTSAGLAHSLGLPDGVDRLTREIVLANARAIVEATDLPVSGDLESCYASTPEGIAETIEAAAAAGLVGGSIEDTTGDPAEPILPVEVAVDRVSAAVQAAADLGTDFVLTARADNFLYGKADLADTIDRLQRYAAAGAAVLYAPALPDLAAVREVCRSVDRPVNVLAGPKFTVAELAEAGAGRISLGSALSRLTLGVLRRAAQEILDDGTFGFSESAIPYGEANTLMAQRAQS